jgi:LuxR family transcriptional regulator, maltose regulon positive regulatory protein
MQKPDPLIRTKLRPPFVRPSLVPRPRLQAHIAEGIGYPLTLVIAPAGFGKTTLVTAGIADCRMPVAWLSLDRDDNQAGRFLTYLIAAVQSADHRIGAEAAQLMAGMQPAPPDAVLTSLVNDLAVAAGELLLVLDDYQFISSLAVHAGVTFLLEHCPNTFHLLIATRSDPPLPLARLRARGQMVELRTADLRFTPTEAVQFLDGVMGLHLDAASVALLEERTEGWVAGLQMAALSMRDRTDVRGFIEGFSGTNRHILDYLLEEILAGQSPEMQRFLLYTSVLDRLSAPLCDVLLSVGESIGPAEDRAPRPSTPVLEYLERENLFVVALDDERTWYRYHHLFADLLRARLHQTYPDLAPRLHVRASAWLEQNKSIPEAIQHLFAAQEIGQAADLIERCGPVGWEESDPSVMQLADSLPPEILTARPKLGLYQAWRLISQGYIEKALPILRDLAQRFAIQPAGPGQRWMQTMVALALAFLSQAKPLPDYQALAEIPAEERILRDAAEILYGMALGRRGEIDRAVEVSALSIRRKKPPHGTLVIPSLVTFLARLYLLQGRLHAAADLCREYLDPLKGRDIRFINDAGMMMGILGEALYDWNRLDEAEQCIRDGLQGNQPWQNILTDAWGLLALTRILVAKEDYPGALQSVEQFETRLQAQTRPFEFTDELLTLRIRVQLASGDLFTPAQWADQVLQNEALPRLGIYYRLTLARIRLAQGRCAEVEKMLATADPLLGSGNRTAIQIEINLLLAAALAGQQRLPEALGLVAACLDLAAPEGYVRIFLDVGEPARELLVAYLKAPAAVNQEYAQKILAAFAPSQPPPAPSVQPSGLVERLTPRELDVLRCLAQGCSNRQIAETLFLSEGTVKFYLHAVMEKLDVHSRTQAVLIARQLNLV